MINARAVVVVGSFAGLGLACAALLMSRQAQAAMLQGSYNDAAANEGYDGMLTLAALDGSAPVYIAPEGNGDDSGGSTLQAAADAVLTPIDDVVFSVTGYRLMSDWRAAALLPKNAPYVAAMQAAEYSRGMPADLLVRQAWQESRFNPAAYNKSSGATGIMQIVPRWHPTVNATDPFASIEYAADFMVQLYRQFGSWELALKAYNWGPANVKAWIAGNKTEPLETRNYSAQILSDVGIA